jgi:DNA-binding NarL/FixJ family response regulator
VKTVETHRSNLSQRLGVGDVSGLVRLALKHGLVGDLRD